jgi:hypothetical protein
VSRDDGPRVTLTEIRVLVQDSREEVLMSRVLPPVLTLMLLLMAAPASAIPICPSGTMADYLGFGSAGCQFNSLTFSDFSYSGGVRIFISGNPLDFFGTRILPPPPPSAISVLPLSNPADLGSGGAALQIAPEPRFLGAYWEFVSIGFDVAGPGIIRDDLSAALHSVANLQSGQLSESALPGGFLGLRQGSVCFANPFDPHSPPPDCGNFRSLVIPDTNFQTVGIGGFNVDGLEAGFATPEPATLLLVGTTAAGLGLARWWKRRRSHAS